MKDIYSMVPPKSGLIFDLDNTLIRCSEYYADAKNSFAMMMCEKTGISQDIALGILEALDAQSIKIDGFGRSRFPKSFQAASVAIDVLMGKAPSKTRAKKAWSMGNSVFTAPYKLYNDALPALEEIKSMDFEMFLCTKGDPQVQARKIRVNKLNKIFPESHIYIDTIKNSTHFLRIIKEHNLFSQDTICIGDSLKDDVGSAHKAGLRSIHVAGQQVEKWAYENETHTPTWSIKCMKKLPALLMEIFCVS
jgi:FMN phosphatase YigB (HAD superfamily)